MQCTFSSAFRRWRKTKITLLAVVALVILSLASFRVGCAFVETPQLPERTATELAPEAVAIEGYTRPEESTYLTYPEWHIVYSTEEYAQVLRNGRPSDYLYFSSIGQYWKSYCTVYKITNTQYGFSPGNHLMLWVIGVSFSVENAVKGMYENTVGRFTEWIAGANDRTEEDDFAAEWNTRYVALMYDKPWYEFPFGKTLGDLWHTTHFWGRDALRKWERKAAQTLELSVKTVYAAAIRQGSHGVYGEVPTEIYARATMTPTAWNVDERIRDIEKLSDGTHIISLPRYRLFSEIVPKMLAKNVRFVDIAGNDEIFLTVLAPEEWNMDLRSGVVLFTMDILTEPGRKRVGITVPVSDLGIFLGDLGKNGAELEHLHDY